MKKQIISVTHAFTEEWNEAKIRCKYKHSKDFDETSVFVLSRECFKFILLGSSPCNDRGNSVCFNN